MYIPERGTEMTCYVFRTINMNGILLLLTIFEGAGSGNAQTIHIIIDIRGLT